MEWLIEAIRGALLEAETGGAWGQAKLAAWIFGPIITVFGLSYSSGRARYKKGIEENETLRGKIKTLEAENERKESALRKIEDETPTGFLKKLGIEERDDNFDRSVDL
ncbi:MAG: hypothetical protein AAGI92_03370 [Pseudomonadota bacterium]